MFFRCGPDPSLLTDMRSWEEVWAVHVTRNAATRFTCRETLSPATNVHLAIVDTIDELGEAHARSVALVEELERQLNESKQLRPRTTCPPVPKSVDEHKCISDDLSASYAVVEEDTSSPPTEAANSSLPKHAQRRLPPIPPKGDASSQQLQCPRRQSLGLHRASVDLNNLTIGNVPNTCQADPACLPKRTNSGRFNKLLNWLGTNKKNRGSHNGGVGALTQDPLLPCDLRVAHRTSSCVEGRQSNFGQMEYGMGIYSLSDLIVDKAEISCPEGTLEKEDASRALAPVHAGRVPPNLRRSHGLPALRASSFTSTSWASKAGSALSANPAAAAQAASIAFGVVGQPAQRLQMRTSFTGPSGPMSCPLSGRPSSISGVRGGSRSSSEHPALLPINGSEGQRRGRLSCEQLTPPAGDPSGNGLGITVDSHISNAHPTATAAAPASNTWAMRPANRSSGQHVTFPTSDCSIITLSDSGPLGLQQGELGFRPLDRGVAGRSASFTTKGAARVHRSSFDSMPMPTPPSFPSRSSLEQRAPHRRVSLTSLHPTPPHPKPQEPQAPLATQASQF